MYDFDQEVIRKGTNSSKWDSINTKEDLISMSVADMDFKCGDFINNVIEKKLSEGVYGYSIIPDSYYEAIISWNTKRYNFNIKKEEILFTPSVIHGILYAIKAITNPKDEIIIQPPVYHRFHEVIERAECTVVNNPLIYKDNKYFMDFEDLKKKITSKTKVLILCSPHNPVGRVWTKEELQKLIDICLEKNIVIISDEIHKDLIFKDSQHNVLSTVDERIKEKCIITEAPTKTFNLAGFQVSNLIICNRTIREKVQKVLDDNFINKPNIFATSVLEAAYNEGEGYLGELNSYIEKNKEYAVEYFKKYIPHIKVVETEGTYLLWLNCSKLGFNGEELNRFFIDKCKLILNKGSMFGIEGESFVRMNIACRRSLLKIALENIKNAIK
ncbi:cystathionine beta-lyase [Clostridiaceae bacterium 14S0207]|nr:cystathionine beta-lyase [Clostridiaceae bacterium 14S0207]